jgi:HD-GYP domain-containing protein (c-di-GMP phosphodiesterase class II)
MVEKTEQQYIPIFLKTIRANTINSFNIYIKLKGKYVLYHAGGENLTESIIDNLKSNKVGIVYVSNKDKESYNRYLVDNLTVISTDKSIPVEERSRIVHYSVRSIAHQFFTKPDMKSLGFFRNSVTKMTDFILLDDEALFNLVRLSSSNFENYVHSINVGVFGTGLAKFLLGQDSRHNIQKVATGLFLHDIGKTLIPQEILNKANPLNHNEWNIIKQHPVEGFKLLNNMNALNDEIKTIVMQHHERMSGRGYPMGLKGNQIHLYSKICSIADSFDALTSKRPYRKSVESSFNALLILKNEMIREVDMNIFQQFVKLFTNSMKKQPSQEKKTITYSSSNTKQTSATP